MGLYIQGHVIGKINSDYVLSGETLWTTSLMKIRNSNGPRTEPCGTRKIIDRVVDCLPLITTHWHLLSEVTLNPLDNKGINTEFVAIGVEVEDCETLLKAFFKSKNFEHTSSLCSRWASQSLVMERRADDVDFHMQKSETVSVYLDLFGMRALISLFTHRQWIVGAMISQGG